MKDAGATKLNYSKVMDSRTDVISWTFSSAQRTEKKVIMIQYEREKKRQDLL